MVKLYTTGCPKCRVLEEKLDGKKIDYVEETSQVNMRARGITKVPVLEVDGEMMEFYDAVKWVNEQ